MWLDKFKIALVTKNVIEMDRLIVEMPKFKDLKDMEEAFYLIHQGMNILESLKNDTLKDMTKIKKNINFLKSSINDKKITSGISYNV